jgi:hypothetical protein
VHKQKTAAKGLSEINKRKKILARQANYSSGIHGAFKEKVRSFLRENCRFGSAAKCNKWLAKSPQPHSKSIKRRKEKYSRVIPQNCCWWLSSKQRV